MEVMRARCSLSTLKKQNMLFIVVLSLKKKKRKGLTLNLADLLSSLRQENQAKLKKEMIKDLEVMRVSNFMARLCVP